jgi:two-component system LytT family sensor kinase
MKKSFLAKYLIRNSSKLFLMYMLSSVLIISIYENSSWHSIVIRALSTFLFSLMVFFTNIRVIAYYKNDNRPEHPNVNKRIFITGYLFTLILFSLYHTCNAFLVHIGIELHMPQSIQNASGWKLGVFIFYISLVQYTFIYLIQNFTLNQYEKSRIELELLKLKTSNAENVNQLLRQQIQPHFLFNALNTLKSLIRKSPDMAEAYLLQLSDFLRASITQTPSGLSTIRDELKICSDYMEMQKIRFGESIHYKVGLEKDDKYLDKHIPSFSLQPLLENAIKHNAATTELPLYITVERQEDWIQVSNNLQHKNSIESSTGSGLTNLRERYRIISGDEVIVEKDSAFFYVRLKILTHEHRNH